MFRGGVPASQHAAMRAPFQDGEFPGAGRSTATSTSAWSRTVRTALLGRDGVLPLPAPDPVRRAGDGGDARARRRAARRARCWPARSRPRSTRCGTRRRWSATGSRWSGAGWSAAASPRCSPRFPGVTGRAGRRRPGAGRRRGRARGRASPRPTTRRATATWSCTPARPAAGLARSLELLADEGEVIELSWYGDRPVTRAARGVVPLAAAGDPGSQVGAVAPARRGRRSYADRMALALRLLADPAFDALITGEIRFADLPRAMPRLAGEPSALCVRVTYDEALGQLGRRPDSCSASPSATTSWSPTASAARSSARPSACTARRSWWTRRSGGPSWTPTTSSSTSGWPPRSCSAVLADLNYRNLDDEPAFAGDQHLHRVPRQGDRRPARRPGARGRARRRAPAASPGSP